MPRLPNGDRCWGVTSCSEAGGRSQSWPPANLEQAALYRTGSATMKEDLAATLIYLLLSP